MSTPLYNTYIPCILGFERHSNECIVQRTTVRKETISYNVCGVQVHTIFREDTYPPNVFLAILFSALTLNVVCYRPVGSHMT